MRQNPKTLNTLEYASARTALLQDANATLDASRKLAVVNGLGEHSRAQARGSAHRTAMSASATILEGYLANEELHCSFRSLFLSGDSVQ